jgi:hypothetical protein
MRKLTITFERDARNIRAVEETRRSNRFQRTGNTNG